MILVFIALGFGFFAGISIFGGTVNLIVLILVASYFLKTEKEGLILSLVLAVFYDFYLYSYFGLALAAVVLIYLALVFLRDKIAAGTSYLLFLILVFFASVIFDLIVLAGFALFHHFNFLEIILYTILPDALINLIAAVPFLIIARRLVSILKAYRLIGPRERKILVGF